MRKLRKIPSPTHEEISEFWKKVEIPGGIGACWRCSKSKRCYGKFKIRNVVYTASRVVWELVYGPIPNRMLVLHSCDVPSCCNPEHLFLGTDQDNSDDMRKKHRQKLGGNRKGWNGDLFCSPGFGLFRLNRLGQRVQIDPATI